MKQTSILSHIVGNPTVSIWESRYPKPPNHVVTGVGIGHSWPDEAIISIAGFRLIPLSNPKREVQKASKLLIKNEKMKYLRQIKSSLKIGSHTTAMTLVLG